VNHPVLHPKTIVVPGVLAEESEKMLKRFFKIRRTGGLADR
jgi:hypothetical protein